MPWPPHGLPLFLSGLLALASCAPRAERAGCPQAQQFGTQGAQWRLCPLNTLAQRRTAPRLAGLGLSHTLTVTELRSAMAQVPVGVRVVYFAAGSVRGTWARPQAQAAAVVLGELEALRQATVTDAQTWTRRAGLQVIEAKALSQLLGPSVGNEEALRRLESSSSLRSSVLNVVREHQAWLDARAVAREKRGWICGLQVEGTPEQLAAFARALGATGFTLDRAELFNSLRPADPPDLRARLERWPGTLSSGQLLRLGQSAFRDFGAAR